MELVVNEWFLEYLRPDSEKFSLSSTFLDIVQQKRDKIAIRWVSPFTNKLYQLNKKYKQSPSPFRLLFLILHDNSVIRLIGEEEIVNLPENISQKVPEDDKYLVELAYTTDEKILVTTDTKLVEALKSQTEIKIYLLEKFLEEYYKK